MFFFLPYKSLHFERYGHISRGAPVPTATVNLVSALALQEELIAACRVKLFISYWSDFASSLFLYFKRIFFKAKYIIYGSKALTSFYHLRIPFGDDIKTPVAVLKPPFSCNSENGFGPWDLYQNIFEIFGLLSFARKVCHSGITRMKKKFICKCTYSVYVMIFHICTMRW